MIVDDDSWFVVRNTPRVTGFVGSGNTPVPMEELRGRLAYETHDGGGAEAPH